MPASRMRRHRAAIAVVVALALLVIGVSSALVVGGGSSGSGTPSPSTASPGTASPGTTLPGSASPGSAAGGANPGSTAAGGSPDPADVAAARTCQAWDTYLSAGLTGTVPSAVGQSLLSDAEALLSGSQQDQAAGRPLPKWVVLGGDVLAGAEDLVQGNSEALQADGATVAAQCKTIPAAAAAAGGFVAS